MLLIKINLLEIRSVQYLSRTFSQRRVAALEPNQRFRVHANHLFDGGIVLKVENSQIGKERNVELLGRHFGHHNNLLDHVGLLALLKNLLQLYVVRMGVHIDDVILVLLDILFKLPVRLFLRHRREEIERFLSKHCSYRLCGQRTSATRMRDKREKEKAETE